MIRILEGPYNDLLAHATRAYPHECCGVLLGTHGNFKSVTAVRALTNTNVTRSADRYEIDPAELNRIDREARKAGLNVLGIYHSHPDHPSRPSEFDRERGFPFYSYVIIAVHAGSVESVRCWSFELDDAPFEEEEIRIYTLSE